MLYRPSVTLFESRELDYRHQIDRWPHSYSLDLQVLARFVFIRRFLSNMLPTEVPDGAFQSSCSVFVQ